MVVSGWQGRQNHSLSSRPGFAGRAMTESKVAVSEASEPGRVADTLSLRVNFRPCVV
jgi:hypothetical protein